MYRAIKYCRILYAFYWRFAIYSHVRTKCIFFLSFFAFPARLSSMRILFSYKNSSQYSACFHLDIVVFVMTNLEMHFLNSPLSTLLDVIFPRKTQLHRVEGKEKPAIS